MSTPIEVYVNGIALRVQADTSVAAAILIAGVHAFRHSPSGQARGPLCGMGICAECRATIDDVPNQYTCQRMCTPGMQICTEAGQATQPAAYGSGEDS